MHDFLACVIVVVEHQQKVRPPNVMHLFFFWGGHMNKWKYNTECFQVSSHRISPFKRDDSKVCVCVLSVSGLLYVSLLALGISTSVARTLKWLIWPEAIELSRKSPSVSGDYAETSCSHPLIAWLYRQL